ncbi:hypothetical protein JOD63_002635 [Microbacterium terrae]|uniref:HXXEE domain-containing protein n=1 Tax=Microbacterium terrae TaxID=69369 RepID=A0A0M2HBQ2_9MICO|nr:HXXEE domain-containing protein [Microbacterium terrae]KJL43924.1 hypothetical protein RS81_00717 [Microbacterium terrae]MBP1078667.1 hypothetical protein [Microbacterium terrae]GLJ98068.1 hypothetical protein GCM10017594_12650 [Microbacterium terrae]
MRWFRTHWYDLGLVVGIAALVVGAIVGFKGLQLILLLNFATLLLHQFEEYRLPGGEPWILNEVSQPKGGPADSYPLNANSASLGNVAMWVPYLVPVFFPDVIWLGLVPVLFGAVGQFVVHVVQTNIKLKTFYNPGCFTVVVGWVPLAIWYLIVAYGEGRVDGWQWLFVVLYGIFMIGFFGFALTYGILQDKTGRYPFTRDEMGRFDRERRLAHAGITPLPFTADRIAK